MNSTDNCKNRKNKMRNNIQQTTCAYCNARLSGPKLRSGENFAVLVRYNGTDFVFCHYCIFQMGNMKIDKLLEECIIIEGMRKEKGT